MNGDSEKFDSILHEFDKLHEQVKKPREQVADAEALLDLTRTLVGSVKSLVNEGVTPSQFVSSLLKHYAHAHPPNNVASIDWHKLGISVSPIFLIVHGSSTMLGPMENQLKQRSKTILSRNRNPRSTTTARPQQGWMPAFKNELLTFMSSLKPYLDFLTSKISEVSHVSISTLVTIFHKFQSSAIPFMKAGWCWRGFVYKFSTTFH